MSGTSIFRKEIILLKKEIFYDIDALTYKRSDVSLQQVTPRIADAFASDSSENFDGSMLTRFSDTRDAELRAMLLFCCVNDKDDTADNISGRAQDRYIYHIAADWDIDGDRLKIAASKMHQYIVYGATYDWYSATGISPAPIGISDIDTIGDCIVNILRGRSWISRPLQPFGPATRLL